MAMNKTSSHQQNVLAWLAGTTMPAAPSAIYLALFTSDPTEAGTVTNELATATGYARQAITLGSATLSTDKHQRVNTAAIIFGPFSSSVAPTHCGIATGSVRGVSDLVYYGTIVDGVGDPVTASSGQAIVVAASSLTVSEG